MRVQLLPSTIDIDGKASARQHLICLVIDDQVAVDAGSLAMSCSDAQRAAIRDIVLSHVHLDHIAGLPMFIDDLFATVTEPIRVHATAEMIEILERDIFNWSVYPRFSELANDNGQIVEYCPYNFGEAFDAKHLKLRPVAVNHSVQSSGLIVSDGTLTIGVTGDTSATDEIWSELHSCSDLAAVFVECAFPNEFGNIAEASHHLTPERLAGELAKLDRPDVPVMVMNIKPMYREKVIEQVGQLAISNVSIVDVGRVYEF